MRPTRFAARASGPADRMAGFMAHLRLNGIPAGVAETEAALRALARLGTDPDDLRRALKAICAHDADRFARFDALFDAYWLNGGRARTATIPSASPHRRTATNRAGLLDPGRADTPGDERSPDDAGGEAAQSGEGRLIASSMSNIAHTDFRNFSSPQDLAAAAAIAERLARAIRDRRSRRRKAAQRGAALDFRRTLRASLARGGEPLDLRRRHRPDRPVHIVALLDVSGSMTVYARIFMAFLRGLTGADRRTEAFLFHTRLMDITDALRGGTTTRAADRLSLMAEGFGGGTKIGASLAQFNAHTAARRVTGRTVVLILSDGYDTGPAEDIAAALRRLRKRGCRIVWLNPLKGWADYAPVARGMAAALPHLDHFAAANTLASLAALEPELARL